MDLKGAVVVVLIRKMHLKQLSHFHDNVIILLRLPLSTSLLSIHSDMLGHSLFGAVLTGLPDLSILEQSSRRFLYFLSLGLRFYLLFVAVCPDGFLHNSWGILANVDLTLLGGERGLGELQTVRSP